MPALHDQQARSSALDPTTSFIVQAPAGSGKTELLTQRYLKLLSRVKAPEEIVAITFTRKASGEMRNRILNALDKARNQPCPSTAHEQITWQLATDVLTQDQACNWDIFDNPGRLRIQTIDSLSISLTQQMPVISGFGSQPAITEDSHQLFTEAARNTIADIESGAKWSSAIEHLIDHRGNNLGDVEGLLTTMLNNRDHWLRHIFKDTGIDRTRLEQALCNLITDALHDIHNAAVSQDVNELMALAHFAATQLHGTHPLIKHCEGIHTLPKPSIETLGLWQGLAELLLTKNGDWRKTANVKIGFPAPSSTKDKDEKAHLKAMKDRMVTLLNDFASADDFRHQLQNIIRLPAPKYRDQQWDTLEALIELLPIAVAHLQLIFKQQGQVDYTEMAIAARRSLGDAEQPTDLALSMDYQLQHILIDEFQDTSLSQYQLLEQLMNGWTADDSRTLFVVGDPMQSIYRFRDAEVGLFLRACHEGLGHIPLTPLTLSVNFRSTAAIVDWVNKTFSQVMPQREDVALGAVSYSPSTAFHHDDSTDISTNTAVKTYPIIDRDDALEAQTIAQIIQDAQTNSSTDSIAILVRSRNHLVEIIPHLRVQGISFQAIEIEKLCERPIIQDLLALTRALCHPADRIAWLAILRAPWCGLSLADLLCLTQDPLTYGEAPPDSATPQILWDAMMQDDIINQLSFKGQHNLKRVRATLKNSLENRQRHSLRRWVEGTWLALGGPACLQESRDLDDAAVFFQCLDNMDNGGQLADFEALDYQIERLYAQPDTQADNRLQIMTVHKAKGLEFDHVILPGLGRPPAPQNPRLLMWMERTRRDANRHDDSDLLLAPIRESGTDEDPLYQYLGALDKEKSRHEDGRLLYVAATRPKQYLHLLGHIPSPGETADIIKAPPKSTLLYKLWPILKQDFEQHTQAHIIENTSIEEQPQNSDRLRRHTQDWQAPEPPPSLIIPSQPAPVTLDDEVVDPVEFLWAGESARHIGTLVHQILQHLSKALIDHSLIVAQLETQRPNYHAALLRAGVPQTQSQVAVDKVILALTRTLSDERGRWILDNKHEAAQSEYPLSAYHQNKIVHIIIDRTFIDQNGTRWIIDFKTGNHEGGEIEGFLDQEQARYKGQLERYAAIIGLQEQHPIRMGLYFPLLQAWREWPYQ